MVPGASAFTTPVAPTVAMGVALLLHVPPVVVSDKVAVEPTQIKLEPVIAAGVGYTVTTWVTVVPP